MSNILEFDRRRGRDELRQKADHIDAGMTGTDGGNGAPPPSATWLSWRASVDARLESVKGAIDGMRWVIGVIAVIMIGGFGFLGFQLNRLEVRVDRIETAVAAIPARLSDEFRAMRSEMAAQTSAIANSITTTGQYQPPPPQIIVIPTPPSEKSPEPKPQ